MQRAKLDTTGTRLIKQIVHSHATSTGGTRIPVQYMYTDNHLRYMPSPTKVLKSFEGKLGEPKREVFARDDAANLSAMEFVRFSTKTLYTLDIR
ncbi:hypothetical protein ACMFMG_004825 [Clarireedia jacksonii]